MRIGVGVEGPSDLAFWNKVLPKHFPGVRFDIRNMKTRDKLIRETPRLLDSFRSRHYAAGFILVDRDRDPCVAAVLERLDAVSRKEARQPVDARYLSVCVAIRGFEAWLLADAAAIKALLPRASYTAPSDTASLNPGEELKSLWQEQYGRNSSPNKIGFASMIAPQFDPAAARQHSASFTYFWSRLTTASQGAPQS